MEIMQWQMFTLYFVLKSLQSIPSCILAAFEIGRSGLANLYEKICIGDSKVFDNRVLQYAIKNLNKSLTSSLAL